MAFGFLTSLVGDRMIIAAGLVGELVFLAAGAEIGLAKGA